VTDPIRLGIFGWPVEHSKSPAMHEAAAHALGIPLVYEKFGVRPEDLGTAIRAKHDEGIDGYNLTVPHKQAVIEMLDDVSDEARAIGAVNTVVRQNGRYVGHNTDAPGFVRSLEDGGVSLGGVRATVVGAGGAARAGVVGLSNAGASHVTVVARRPDRAEAMVEALQDQVGASLHAHSLADARPVFSVTDLLVQATSATLESNPDAQAFADLLPMDALPKTASVVDMVYQPLVTTVLGRAADLGLRTVDGLGMLLHQGAIAFEMWTGREPPLDVMRAALSD
jgi:shikimate dehydrogenase